MYLSYYQKILRMKSFCLIFGLLIGVFTELVSQTYKVLIIGVDGFRSDALEIANTPNFDDLINNGSYSYDALNNDITVSGPGWSAMLTGVWSAKHGVTNNNFTGSNYEEYPHFFHYVEAHDPSLHTVSICNWNPINDEIVGNTADYKMNVSNDEAVAMEATDYLSDQDPDVLFLHFDEVDGIGHSTGFDPTNLSYLEGIEEVDSLIGIVIDALENRDFYETENWLILSCTDHGGIGFSHGGTTIEEENIFFIASGDDIPKQEIKKDSFVSPPPINCLLDTVELCLDGFNDYLEIPSDPLFEFGSDQDFTIEIRVRTNQAADVAIIGNKDWDSGSLKGFVFSFKYPSGPQWKVNLGDGTNRADLDVGGEIADDEWHTLSVSFDRDGMMKMYENGQFVDETNIDFIGDINSGSPIRIGVDSDMEYDYKGKAAECRIWNKIIQAETIQEWYCNTLDNSHPDYSDLLGHWKMNDGGSSSGSIDHSPNGNDANIFNALWNAPENQVDFDYALTPRITDVALSALAHLCIPIESEWDLDGKPIFSACPPYEDPCTVDTINLSYTFQDTYHAKQIIHSKAVIDYSEMIQYFSGDTIHLEAGFEILPTTSFEGSIVPCEN